MDLQKEVIRALWWKQPYAFLMLHGKIETRTWKTNVRGKVLICASQRDYTGPEVVEISGPYNTRRIDATLHMHKHPLVGIEVGHAIAIGDLVDCYPMRPEDEEDTFVKYREGLWCHVYKNVQRIEPFPIKGQQGWKVLSSEEKLKIKIINERL